MLTSCKWRQFWNAECLDLPGNGELQVQPGKLDFAGAHPHYSVPEPLGANQDELRTSTSQRMVIGWQGL